jgi:hypothetical protein
MSLRLKMLLLASLFLISKPALFAQDNDFLRHRKFFDICSIKKQCEHCNTCDQQRVIVKINNKENKKISNVWYKFYSPVFNRILEKEAKIVGDKIEAKQIGQFYVCVRDVHHWIVSKIVYADESVITFSIKDRIENFIQEPDECDCND